MPFPKNPDVVSLHDVALTHGAIYPGDDEYVEQIVTGIIFGLRQALLQGRCVELHGVGRIEVGTRPPRKVSLNVGEGRSILYETGPRRAVRLKLSKAFQHELNGAYCRSLADGQVKNLSPKKG